MCRRRPTPAGAAALRWVAVWCLILCPAAWAGTQNYGAVTVDLEASTELQSLQGYATYRLTVSNRGDRPRRVRVMLPAQSWGYGDAISGLSTTVQVEPGATARTELLQPPLPMTGDGAAVWIDGSRQDDRIALPITDHMNQYGGEPILVSRGLVGPVTNAFADAMTQLADSSRTSNYPPLSGSGTAYFTSDRLARMYPADRPVREWSESWLSYSSATAVMLTADELRDAPPGVDAALRAYVLAGGSLVVMGEGGIGTALGRLWSAGWLAEGVPAEAQRVGLGLGDVEVTPRAGLVERSAEEWERWIRRAAMQSGAQPTRVDAQQAESALPMLRNVSVPVRWLLVLMLGFVLLMGPINIGLLTWWRRRMWLLWTVPLIALMFSGTVLAYSLLSEGIRPRARTVALTLLDQPARTAVTTATTGYYAPLTPGGGLFYGRQTLVVPQVDEDRYGYSAGRTREIDLTRGQHLTRGWITARTPAHFVTRTVETRRERLEIRRDGESGLSITNGLGHRLRRLLVTDTQGRVYELQDLAAGVAAVVEPTDGYQVARSYLPKRFDVDHGPTVSRLASHPEEALAPGTYVAVLDNASLAEPALAGLTEHESVGVVLGRWQEGR